jgi:hypothetical protein
MARNWSQTELAEILGKNPGLRIATQPLDRAPEPPPPPIPRKQSHTPQNAGHTVDWLAVLLQVPTWRARLDPEAALSVAVATELRRLSLAGQLRCVWTRVPGEHEQGGRIGAMHQVKRAVTGYVAGVPDFAFFWGTGSGLIELKTQGQQSSFLTPDGVGLRSGRKTYQSKPQRMWQRWAESHGVKVEVVRSVPELRTALRSWGVLDA